MSVSGLKELASYTFLYVIALGSAGVIGFQALHGMEPQLYLVGIVTTVMGYAINAQGVSHGVSATNDTVAKTAAAQYPLTQATPNQPTLVSQSGVIDPEATQKIPKVTL